jgi:hypothetical protein
MWKSRARALRQLPATFEAFCAGGLSFTQVRAISRVATTDDEHSFIEMARHATGGQLERLVSGLRRASELTLHPTSRAITTATGKPVPHRHDWPRQPAEHLDADTTIDATTLPPRAGDTLDLHYAIDVLMQHAA